MDTQQALQPAEILQAKLQNKSSTICVIGLGYVGLPLLLALHEQYNVIGFDVDETKVSNLLNGTSYLKSFTDCDIKKLQKGKSFVASCCPTVLTDADVIIICVPTPLTKNREPDMRYVQETTELIAHNLQKGQLIILESTTYPGTTTELMLPILQKKQAIVGKDFFIAYSPEREDPGNKKHSAVHLPKVVGADEPNSQRLAKMLYQAIVPEVIVVSSLATAEAVKLMENIFRCANIALVNELKMIFTKMNIDIWEVIEAAKTKPFGFMPFYPGPGLGGHCIPIDPFYLTWKAREYGMVTRFVELSGEINAAMPEYVINRLREELDCRFGKALNGASILLIGMAYKKNVDDIRESPGLTIFELLLDKKAQVDYHDPFINMIPNCRGHAGIANIHSVALNPANLQKYDAAIICTDHDCVDYTQVVDNVALVVDTRNVTAHLKGKDNVISS